LYSIVTLYGKLTYLVLLGEIEISNPLMEQLADAHEFSIDRTTNKPVGILELASRMVAQATQTDTPRTEAKEKK
ncbi:MAG TPA: hypothetical protein PKI03_38755, partial [Pseudomonadota bacterium]|nr:hypothetical protein [Pseudomonadota bacterium]